MKYLSLIMCFYVCLLLSFPCQDNGVHAGVPGHMASEQTTHHDHDEGECHHCSPFCTCNCCHVQVITSLFIISGAPANVIIPPIGILQERISEGMHYAIWQPPKA